MKKLLLFASVLSATAVFAGMQMKPVMMKELRSRQTVKENPLHTPKGQLKAAADTAAAVDTTASEPVATPDYYLSVPFDHSLGKYLDVKDKYTIIDANGDGRTWSLSSATYGVCLSPNTDAVQKADDWLISPAIELKAGKKYTMTLALTGGTASKPKATAGVFLGNAATVAAMTTKLVDYADRGAGSSYETVEADFEAEKDGFYYIGIHAVTDKALNNYTRTNRFIVKEYTPKVDPPAKGSMTWTVAPKGELKATVKYTAPTKTKTGAALEKITKVEIYNWVTGKDEYVTFDSVAPGQTLTCELRMLQGMNNKFRAVAYVNDTPGEMYESPRVFAGLDNPTMPANLKAKLSDDFKKVTLSWDAVPSVGPNGGYVDSTQVSYYIFDAFGSYTDPSIADTTGTSYTFDYSNVAGQDFVAYQVTAAVGLEYYSDAATSNIAIVGTPDALPWHESFTDGYYTQMMMVEPGSSSSVMRGTVFDNELQTNTDQEGAEPVYLNSHDADNGFFMMLPYQKDVFYGMQSAKIDVSTAGRPAFEFYYQGKGSKLEMMVANADGEFETVKAIDLKEDPTDAWTLARYDLSAYKAAPYIRIGIRMSAIHNTDTETWSVPLDNIRIIDLDKNDMRLCSFIAPESIIPGAPVEIKSSVENLSEGTMANATVVLSDAKGQMRASVQLDSIAAGVVRTFALPMTATIFDEDAENFTLAVQSDNDAVASNSSAAAKVKIDHLALPGVENLSASAQGPAVNLEWSAPAWESYKEAREVMEDFENPSYPLFSLKGFGGWTMVDVDKLKTYTFLKDENNPIRTQAQAFTLFNAEASGMPEDWYQDAQAHSGKNFLVAFSCQGTNDNWLISPALSGVAQTVSFWAKSFTIAFPESFEVYASSTGKELANFSKVETVTNYPADNRVPETWTEFSFDLPEGTQYFAVRHTSYDSYALYLDDFKFKAQGIFPADLQLTGYKVYNDRKHVAEVAENKAQHTAEVHGINTYHVSAVYNYGETRASAPVDVQVDLSGLENLKADKEARYFTVDGVEVNPANATKGVYIVKCGSKAYKIVK